MSSALSDHRTAEQIYKEAATVNDQVTDGLKGALRIVDDTRDVQGTTLTELKKQGEQLGEIQEAIEDVREDTKYAHAVLDDIGCLCWCFGRKKSNKIKRPQHPGRFQQGSKNTARPKEIQPMFRTGANEEATFKESGSGSKHETSPEDGAVKRIEKGKREQDALIDQIAQGLDVLAQGAKAMGEELAAQDTLLDATEKRTDDATEGTKDVIRHSAFRRHIR